MNLVLWNLERFEIEPSLFCLKKRLFERKWCSGWENLRSFHSKIDHKIQWVEFSNFLRETRREQTLLLGKETIRFQSGMERSWKKEFFSLTEISRKGRLFDATKIFEHSLLTQNDYFCSLFTSSLVGFKVFDSYFLFLIKLISCLWDLYTLQNGHQKSSLNFFLEICPEEIWKIYKDFLLK